MVGALHRNDFPVHVPMQHPPVKGTSKLLCAIDVARGAIDATWSAIDMAWLVISVLQNALLSTIHCVFLYGMYL